MSTKIYHGFKINTSSISKVLEMVETFRPYILEEGKKLYKNFEDHLLGYKKIDQTKEDAIKDIRIKWLTAWWEMKRTQQRLPLVDTLFSITIFPLDDYFLGIVYTEHDTWYFQWLEQENVEDYAYWNNSDKPDKLTDEEWDERYKNWSKVLLDNKQGQSLPAMCGFSIDIADPNGIDPIIFRKEND